MFHAVPRGSEKKSTQVVIQTCGFPQDNVLNICIEYVCILTT